MELECPEDKLRFLRPGPGDPEWPLRIVLGDPEEGRKGGSLNPKLLPCPLLCSQEQEKEARSRAAYISALPASPHWGRGFDEDKDEDEGSPGGCNPAGGNGGDFHRLVF